ncbi:exonuclease domain-containing protein [Parasphingorhabdus sp.]|uniref:exonuclease domain-containing protein n=1 Tax=Parasphingorhabdus sp. TaxID=2709688 RepID=UPI003BAF659B
MYAFYDLETTGTSAAYDQPLQFAAVRTDDNFQIIEKFEARCRLASHILPSPWALAITGIKFPTLIDETLPELFDFSQIIARLIEKWTPSTWIGYNNLAFDEEMLRQMFYQNLHPNNYLTQINGNDRLDVMKAVFAAHSVSPDTMSWPTTKSGRVSFRLDQLAPKNGLNSHNSHDALGDVYATIHIAKKMATNASELWANLAKCRNKNYVNKQLEYGAPLRLIVRDGPTAPKAIIGTLCGRNASNPNQIAFLDLETPNIKEILSYSDDELEGAIFKSPRKIRILSVNSAPPILPVASCSQALHHAAKLVTENRQFSKRIGQVMSRRYDQSEPSQYVETRIYEGFYNQNDIELLFEFQRSNWEKRATLSSRFQDERLIQLGSRLIGKFYPEGLGQDQTAKTKIDELESRKFAEDPSIPWMTYTKAIMQLDSIKNTGTLSASEYDVLENLYLEQCF